MIFGVMQTSENIHQILLCTSSESKSARTAWFLIVAKNINGSSEWNLLCVIQMAQRILMLLLDFRVFVNSLFN